MNLNNFIEKSLDFSDVDQKMLLDNEAAPMMKVRRHSANTLSSENTGYISVSKIEKYDPKLV